MDLATLSIKRPVFTIVLSIAIMLFGLLAFVQLGVREYPAIDPPTISITTSYAGASADVIEAQITEPIEEAINSVAGIRTLTSTSREGSSQITAEFNLDVALDTAASDVRDQLARATRNLPPDANPPIFNKADADASPILGLTFASDRRSQLELAAFADTIKERLQTVPGIASVFQPAEKRYAMRLWMEPDKLAAYGLTPLDVRTALQRENVELPSGRLEGDLVELPVKTLSRLSTAEEFERLVIKREGDRIVRFHDVGFAELGAQNERSALKVGNTPVAGLYFRAQPGANQIEIVDELLRRLKQLQREVPPDITVAVAYDNTTFVRRSIAEVEETLFIAFELVVGVVFAFFREWRTTLIPILAIPVSIIGAFFIMRVAGFSINVLTLLGLVLAIGLVVDDAIVVLENIYTKIEAGVPPVEAGIAGTREIFFAVIATTITLAVVFLPLLFLGGLSGRLFREFGLTIAGAVVLSAFVALTLTPMLSSRLLKRKRSHGWLFRSTEPLFEMMTARYGRGLERCMRWRWVAPIVLIVTIGLIFLFAKLVPRELVPMEDRGRITVRATGPEGVSFDTMHGYMDDLTQVLATTIPEADVMMTQVPGGGGGGGVQGVVNSGFVRVFLPEKSERSRSQQDIVDDVQKSVRSLSGARINVSQESTIGDRRASGGGGVQFVIQAANLAALEEVLPAFLDDARKSEVFVTVDSDLKFNKPEVQVTIDRDRAQTLGVTSADIASTLQAALSGQRFGYFIFNGKQYDVVGQLTRDFRRRPEDLAQITVRSAIGAPVRLDNLVTLGERSSPPELYRYNRYIAATISGSLARDRTLDDGIAEMRGVAARVLDDRFTTELTGSARDYEESSSSLGYVFLLALALIYLVLAAQFESFRDPLVILITVPLALAGAWGTLWLFNQSMNIFSQIGLIMLIGLVTKNGILIVEFANQRREADPSLTTVRAVHSAAVARLRPILMTTLATILGILPIALALGAGAESRVSMGIGVIGGLLFGSALTLFVIPMMYVLMAKRLAGQPAEKPVSVAIEADAVVVP